MGGAGPAELGGAVPVLLPAAGGSAGGGARGADSRRTARARAAAAAQVGHARHGPPGPWWRHPRRRPPGAATTRLRGRRPGDTNHRHHRGALPRAAPGRCSRRKCRCSSGDGCLVGRLPRRQSSPCRTR